MIPSFARLLLLSFLPIFCLAQPEDTEWVGKLDYGGQKLPFKFEIVGDQIIFSNGIERIEQQIESVGDSFNVWLKPFDAVIRAKYSGGRISGVWEKPYRKSSVPFVAELGTERYQVTRKAKKVGDKWSMTFEAGENGYPAVELFNQSGNQVSGTVQTDTGDFRFFEGVVNGDSIKMGSFDGAHGFLLHGKKTGKKWSGTFYFEPGYTEGREAVVDNNATISDPFQMVEIEKGVHTPYYDLLGAGQGRNSIDVDRYSGKVLVIQVFGTWCPNSLDQTNYLLDWFLRKPKDVEILSVTYEPNFSKEYGMRRISEYVSHLQIPYDVVLGGSLSKSQAAMPFPFMNRIQAFPTLVLIDKEGYARYVHSYFSGPATGDDFEKFKVEFEEKIRLLAEE